MPERITIVKSPDTGFRLATIRMRVEHSDDSEAWYNNVREALRSVADSPDWMLNNFIDEVRPTR